MIKARWYFKIWLKMQLLESLLLKYNFIWHISLKLIKKKSYGKDHLTTLYMILSSLLIPELEELLILNSKSIKIINWKSTIQFDKVGIDTIKASSIDTNIMHTPDVSEMLISNVPNPLKPDFFEQTKTENLIIDVTYLFIDRKSLTKYKEN
jgi:hypothetical protein